jgi:phosphoglycolate phosphatase
VILLFDLDGTLTDSCTGITRCLRHAVRSLGRDALPESQLTSFIGQPLAQCFESLLGSNEPALVARAIALYRRRFERVGIFETRLYPGVPDALRDLAGAGHAMHVVTVKPAVYARRILEHFDLDRYFVGVFGPALAGEPISKSALVRDVLRGIVAPPREVMVIGDRAADIAAGRANGVRALAVAWGYGDAQELDTAQPNGVVASWPDLVTYIQRLAPGA